MKNYIDLSLLSVEDLASLPGSPFRELMLRALTDGAAMKSDVKASALLQKVADAYPAEMERFVAELKANRVLQTDRTDQGEAD